MRGITNIQHMEDNLGSKRLLLSLKIQSRRYVCAFAWVSVKTCILCVERERKKVSFRQ